MSQVELPYEDTKESVINSLQKQSLGVLATSKEDIVRAGMMRIISQGLKVYCFTDMNSRKYNQIQTNPNVAIVAKNIQIEGKAILKGNPADEASFLEAYKESQPDNYASSLEKGHFDRSNFRVIEINPSRIALYKGIDVEAGTLSHIDVLNLQKKQAHRITWLTSGKEPLNLSNAKAYIER